MELAYEDSSEDTMPCHACGEDTPAKELYDADIAVICASCAGIACG